MPGMEKIGLAAVMLVVDDKFDFALVGYTKERNTDLVGKCIRFRFWEKGEGFKLDKDSGKECYMLGAKDLSIAWHDDTRYWQRGHVPQSRFVGVAILGVCRLDICGIIPSVILSPKSTYVAYLVFQITRDSTGLDVPAVGCKPNPTSVSYTLTKWYQEPGYDKQWQKTEPLAKAKPKASKDKEVNQATRDSDDALICCVENTVEDRIMDSGASFHATYCKEELERFKLCSGKVRLADDKTLDITGVGSVFLRTSFGTSLIMKDVRWFGEAEESFLHNVREDKKTVETAAGVAAMAKMRWDIAFGIQRVTRAWGEFMKATQSPGGSTYTSEGSENNRSFEDSGRSDEEDSKDIASSETPQVRRSTKESKALVRDKFTDSSAETLHEMDSKSALSVIKVQFERPRSSMFKRRLIAADQASVFMEMTSVHISSGLVLHQMTSDHNRSELGIQDHSNEPSSSKLVPKVVP
ncbi:retrovirus-related pol polyprotein from transposon TNT 1-94 [Tanacetum coccineum]